MPLPPGTSCPDCCGVLCYAPTVVWRSRSASKSKQGYAEFAGYVSDPPKRYLVRTETSSLSLSDTTSGNSMTGEFCCWAFSNYSNYSSGGSRATTVDADTGSSTTDPVPANGTTISGYTNTYTNSECSGETDCPGFNESVEDPPSNNLPWDYQIPGRYGATIITDVTTSATSQSTTKSVNYSNPTTGDDPGCGCSNDSLVTYVGASSFTVSLSMEDTTEALIARTEAALPEDYPNSTAGSYRNLPADELSYSIRESQYSFRFRIPELPGVPRPLGDTLYIRWTERFTPLAGGDPVDTERCVAWDGVEPSGYDKDDSGTWPQINSTGSEGWESLAIPETNGTITVVNVAYSCKAADAC